MKRAPIVIGVTAVGLAAVLTFRTHSAPLSLGTLNTPTKSTAGSSGASSTSTSGSRRSSGSAGASSPSSSASPSTTTTAPSNTTAAKRTATGPSVNYSYGVLSVSVTVSGHKITDVSIASLDDGGNFRSQSIDEGSIPILEQEAIQAQSANIQGVSGASYTSSGFEQSLQGALKDLGL